MIRHIVLWKLTEKAKGENLPEKISRLRQMFAAMLGNLPGLFTIEIGENFGDGEYDLILFGEYESREAVEAYRVHPLHLEVRELTKDWVCGRVSVDYEYAEKDA